VLILSDLDCVKIVQLKGLRSCEPPCLPVKERTILRRGAALAARSAQAEASATKTKTPARYWRYGD
jgi:hypothetical protein